MTKKKYKLWSPSAIGAIYLDKKGKMYVYHKPYLTDIKTGNRIRVEGII